MPEHKEHFRSINEGIDERLLISGTEDKLMEPTGEANKDEGAMEPFSVAEVKARRDLLICILVSLFVIQTVNMNVTTLVPNYC